MYRPHGPGCALPHDDCTCGGPDSEYLDPTAPPATTLLRTLSGPTSDPTNEPLGAQMIRLVEDERICPECGDEIPSTQPFYVRFCGPCGAVRYL